MVHRQEHKAQTDDRNSSMRVGNLEERPYAGKTQNLMPYRQRQPDLFADDCPVTARELADLYFDY